MASNAGPLEELNKLLAKTAQAGGVAQCSQILCALLHMVVNEAKKDNAAALSMGLLEAVVSEQACARSLCMRAQALHAQPLLQ